MRFDFGDPLFGCQEEDWEEEGDVRSCHEMGPIALAKAAYESVRDHHVQTSDSHIKASAASPSPRIALDKSESAPYRLPQEAAIASVAFAQASPKADPKIPYIVVLS